MTSEPLVQNNFILRRPSVAIFADIIKIVIIFFKTIFKGSREVKIIRNYINFIKNENPVYICIS